MSKAKGMRPRAHFGERTDCRTCESSKKNCMGKPHKRMAIIFGLGIACYGAWTLFLCMFSLIAESGGKDSNPWVAVGVFLPLIELIRTWVWINMHADEYAISRSRKLGDSLVIGSMVASPPITLWVCGPLFFQLGAEFWPLSFAVPGLLTIIACWAARKLWSRTEASGSGSVLGL